MAAETKTRWDDFFLKLDRAIKAEFPYSIVLEDPLANSFVQKNVDSGDDPQIKTEEYERTEEEMEDLGLNDMKTKTIRPTEMTEVDSHIGTPFECFLFYWEWSE